MPHTSRRKTRSLSNKLVKVTADDGWATITRKGVAQMQSSQSNNSDMPSTKDSLGSLSSETEIDRIHERLTIPQMEQLQALLRSNAHPNPPKTLHPYTPHPAECSELELLARFNEIKALWNTSGIGQRIIMMLKNQVNIAPLRSIKKAMCLGLGSLSVDKFGWRRASMWQLVSFLEMARNLSEEVTAQTIVLSAQDPAFNEVDRRFLESLHINVAESPNGFSQIDYNTFVFAPHYSVAWWPSTMRMGYTPLIIGNDVEKALPRIPEKDEIEKVLQRASGMDQGQGVVDSEVKQELATFLKRYSSIALPDVDETQHAFIDLRLYWKLQTDDNEDG